MGDCETCGYERSRVRFSGTLGIRIPCPDCGNVVPFREAEWV